MIKTFLQSTKVKLFGQLNVKVSKKAVLVLLLVAVVALAAAGSGHKEGKGHHKGKKEVKEARTLEAKRPDAKEAKKCHGK
ncbi:hypothetical protein FOCC_FOCC004099 [Frankliniella occidentalis]|nr:hypothetical protein FOCC_FOCC004099 [Frankliniella occidentalis]